MRPFSCGQDGLGHRGAQERKKKIMDPRLIEALRETAMKAWNSIQEVIAGPTAAGKSPMDMVIDFVQKQAIKAKEALSPDAIKLALAYEEKCLIDLDFKELLSFVKKTYSLKPGMRICILMTKDSIVKFDIMACNEKNEITFSASSPWCHLVVADPSAELIAMFGDKSMLVLK